jgi:hypothetical protein
MQTLRTIGESGSTPGQPAQGRSGESAPPRGARARVRAACGLVIAASLAGCGWMGSTSPDRTETARSGEVSSGPALGSTREGTAGAGARAVELEYLDLLERRPLIGADDMLSGLLMVRTGSMGRNYMARVTEARRLGIVDETWDAPARRAMTAEDLAVAVVATLGDLRSRAAALAYVQSRGWLPSDLAPSSTVSGAQFLSLLGSLSDELARRGRGGSSMRPPAGAEPDPFDQLGFGPTPGDGRAGGPEVVGPSRGSDPSSLMAVLPATAPRARPEPLPDLR